MPISPMRRKEQRDRLGIGGGRQGAGSGARFIGEYDRQRGAFGSRGMGRAVGRQEEARVRSRDEAGNLRVREARRERQEGQVRAAAGEEGEHALIAHRLGRRDYIARNRIAPHKPRCANVQRRSPKTSAALRAYRVAAAATNDSTRGYGGSA